jgi:hypothetical protein
MGALLFTCPTTKLKVQHWLDDDDRVPEDEFHCLRGLHQAALHQPKNRKAAGREVRAALQAGVVACASAACDAVAGITQRLARRALIGTSNKGSLTFCAGIQEQPEI